MSGSKWGRKYKKEPVKKAKKKLSAFFVWVFFNHYVSIEKSDLEKLKQKIPFH